LVLLFKEGFDFFIEYPDNDYFIKLSIVFSVIEFLRSELIGSTLVIYYIKQFSSQSVSLE